MIAHSIENTLGYAAASMVERFIDSDNNKASFKLLIKLERSDINDSVYMDASAIYEWIQEATGS